MAYTAYFFMFSKIIELLDTVFFVLRKKMNQVTTLHVWHHSFMVISYYWGIKHYPGGHGSFVGFLNSGIHVIMYSYYLLSALGPWIQRYLWWKRYLTTLQMVQFTAIFVHSMQLLFVKCNVPPALIAYTMFNTVVFFILFRNFFVQAYYRIGGRGREKDGDSGSRSFSSLTTPCYPQGMDLKGEDNDQSTKIVREKEKVF